MSGEVGVFTEAVIEYLLEGMKNSVELRFRREAYPWGRRVDRKSEGSVFELRFAL